MVRAYTVQMQKWPHYATRIVWSWANVWKRGWKNFVCKWVREIHDERQRGSSKGRLSCRGAKASCLETTAIRAAAKTPESPLTAWQKLLSRPYIHWDGAGGCAAVCMCSRVCTLWVLYYRNCTIHFIWTVGDKRRICLVWLCATVSDFCIFRRNATWSGQIWLKYAK